jgi:hypothetical protein
MGTYCATTDVQKSTSRRHGMTANSSGTTFGSMGSQFRYAASLVYRRLPTHATQFTIAIECGDVILRGLRTCVYMHCSVLWESFDSVNHSVEELMRQAIDRIALCVALLALSVRVVDAAVVGGPAMSSAPATGSCHLTRLTTIELQDNGADVFGPVTLAECHCRSACRLRFCVCVQQGVGHLLHRGGCELVGTSSWASIERKG